MDEIEIQFLDDVPEEGLKAPVLIEGLPGIGHVGKLVAEHMIQELGAKK
ncbi:MAG TPA: PAC2 family protein, partial [Methanoregulaceae archaeon]|nr:PAC2 family protein [Methanoregulaceae archaeon]